MAFVFRRDEEAAGKPLALPEGEAGRPLWQNAAFLASLAAILVFASWGRPATDGPWLAVYEAKWVLTSAAALVLGWILVARFGIARWKVGAAALAVLAAALLVPRHPEVAFAVGAVALSLLVARAGGEAGAWLESSWGFARQILPLLFAGVLVAGMLLGRPGGEGLVPGAWVAAAVGGNSPAANLFAALAGALMYFATLTEVPIVQGLLANGMGQGPALALLLAGPALSLPNMLVIASVLGWRKTSVYVALVVVLAALTGLVYGSWFV
jgi:uncharacterized membrane protein YraQ (UPF0718 family)